jgi:hypothetical protein
LGIRTRRRPIRVELCRGKHAEVGKKSRRTDRRGQSVKKTQRETIQGER